MDISADLGEASGDVAWAVDGAIYPLVTSASVACGGHAGDDDSMRRSIRLALDAGVSIGAHPSYPDREGFGRRSMQIDHSALHRSLAEQIERLSAIAREERAVVRFVKVHGALYNDAHRDAMLARAVARAVASAGELAVVCGSRSAMAEAARDASLRVVREAFADRRYQQDGALVARSEPDALLLDPHEAADQAVSIVISGRVETSLQPVPVVADTLCLHSDMEGVVARLTAVRAALQREGVTIRSCHA